MGNKNQRTSELHNQLAVVSFDWDSESAIPADIEAFLDKADERLQAYWDAWIHKPIEQYVACDFRDVWRALHWIASQEICDGRLFCEWGCGFGFVTALASKLGWEAIGIEAEPFLVKQAKQLLEQESIQAEIWLGNFLPPGAERLAKAQSNHASLFHQVPSAYADRDLSVDDFALIFAYPWPGEDSFLKNVFATYARAGAHLLLFLGPYEIQLLRKLP